MRVFLFKKNVELLDVLQKIDPNIEFDENGQILRTSTLRRNLFLQDIPRPMFIDNNLMSDGALLSSHDVGTHSIHLFFEGRFKDILDHQYQYLPFEKLSKKDQFTVKVDSGEIFNINSNFNIIEHKFREYIREVEVVNKKPFRECERPDLTKICIEVYKKHKKKALFREYLSRDIIAKGSLKEEEIYSAKEKRALGKLSLFNEMFYYKIKDEKLTSGELNIQLKKPTCRKVKTGFIKFVEDDDSVKLTTPQENVVRTFCDGPIYNSRIKKVKLR